MLARWFKSRPKAKRFPELPAPVIRYMVSWLDYQSFLALIRVNSATHKWMRADDIIWRQQIRLQPNDIPHVPALNESGYQLALRLTQFNKEQKEFLDQKEFIVISGLDRLRQGVFERAIYVLGDSQTGKTTFV